MLAGCARAVRRTQVEEGEARRVGGGGDVVADVSVAYLPRILLGISPPYQIFHRGTTSTYRSAKGGLSMLSNYGGIGSETDAVEAMLLTIANRRPFPAPLPRRNPHISFCLQTDPPSLPCTPAEHSHSVPLLPLLQRRGPSPRPNRAGHNSSVCPIPSHPRRLSFLMYVCLNRGQSGVSVVESDRYGCDAAKSTRANPVGWLGCVSVILIGIAPRYPGRAPSSTLCLKPEPIRVLSSGS
jgi:hypothetical protein